MDRKVFQDRASAFFSLFGKERASMLARASVQIFGSQASGMASRASVLCTEQLLRP